MFHFEVIGPVPSPSSLQWSKVESEKSLAGGLCKGKKGEKRKPTASLLRISPHVGNHQRLFKCQYSPDAVRLCLARFEVCGQGKGQRGFSFFFHPQNYLTNSPDFVRAKQKHQSFFFPLHPPNWRPAIRVEKLSPRRSDKWSTFIFYFAGVDVAFKSCTATLYIFFFSRSEEDNEPPPRRRSAARDAS